MVSLHHGGVSGALNFGPSAADRGGKNSETLKTWTRSPIFVNDVLTNVASRLTALQTLDNPEAFLRDRGVLSLTSGPRAAEPFRGDPRGTVQA